MVQKQKQGPPRRSMIVILVLCLSHLGLIVPDSRALQRAGVFKSDFTFKVISRHIFRIAREFKLSSSQIILLYRRSRGIWPRKHNRARDRALLALPIFVAAVGNPVATVQAV